MLRPVCTLVATFAFALVAFADNWPAWRGADGSGHTAEKNLPTEWDTTKNVRWKTPLPDGGNSTPIVWGDQIFLTQASDKGQRRAVLCVDRTSGKILWQKETVYKEKEPTHSTNPYCSASPVTDGERVIASLGSAGMVCYDLDGKELWRKDVGRMEHIWGNASSPILYQDLAILWVGPGKRQVLLAVNKKDGKTVWEHEEPGGEAGGDAKTWIGSWSTPTVIRVDDHDELILSAPLKLKGFDPKSGKELWSCEGLGRLVYTSPVYANGIILTMSGFHGPAMAVRTGGKGDITGTHRLWLLPRPNPQRIGSAAIVGEHAYILQDDGSLGCLELKTGKNLWAMEKRLNGSWSSMVAAGERLYCTTKNGDTMVLAAKPQFELIARNSLGEHTLSSIAVSDGELFIRTYKHLWCIRSKN